MMTSSCPSELTSAVTGAAEQALLVYGWPGNVRELRNAMERAALLVESGPLGLEALPTAVQSPRAARSDCGSGGSLRERLDRAEREILGAALNRNGGVIRRAALELDANPVTLARRARRLGLVD